MVLGPGFIVVELVNLTKSECLLSPGAFQCKLLSLIYQCAQFCKSVWFNALMKSKHRLILITTNQFQVGRTSTYGCGMAARQTSNGCNINTRGQHK